MAEIFRSTEPTAEELAKANELAGLTYPSLAEGPPPAERAAKLIEEARKRGVKPMTEEEFAQFIEENRELWPDEKEIDEFIAWLHRCRRQGRYD